MAGDAAGSGDALGSTGAGCIETGKTASVVMEPGVFFTGRCTMLEHGPEALEFNADPSPAREREYARD